MARRSDKRQSDHRFSDHRENEIPARELKLDPVACGAQADIQGLQPLERFRFTWNHESAPSCCFVAFPDGEPVSTSPGKALDAVHPTKRWSQAVTSLLAEIRQWITHAVLAAL
jgi:hypothetical protein